VRVLFLVAMLLAPAAAWGQDMKAAQAHFKDGVRFQGEGRYDEAIASYEKAYEISRLPDLVFNIAQCQRLKGDAPRALEQYRRYLALDPNGRGSAEAKQHLATLEKVEAERLRAEELARQRQAAEEARQRELDEAKRLAAEERRRAEAEARRREEAEEARRTDLMRERRERRAQTFRVAGIASAGTAALLVGAGVVFALRASGLQSDAEAAVAGGRWDPRVEDLIAEGELANTLTVVFAASGAALLVTGGVLYLVGGRSPVDAVTVAPLHDGGAALVVSGRF
jgi:tetratricopeptide (TPR) repeat protein